MSENNNKEIIQSTSTSSSTLERPRLSIIVPIYNVEPYLRKCVDSLLHQDYDDYEIILVDDGGKDGCPAICDEYAELSKKQKENGKNCPDIRVVHRENGGLSAARNSGIEIAKGDYLCFVDSDDYWNTNVLGSLMKTIEDNKLDVLRFDYNIVDESGRAFWPIKAPKVYDRATNIIDGSTYLEQRMSTQNYVWQFVVRKSICPSFIDGIYFEDLPWTPQMLWNAKRVIYQNINVYNYLWRQGTISRTADIDKKKKTINDVMTILEYHVNNLLTHPNSKWLTRTIGSCVVNILSLVAQYDYDERYEIITKLKRMPIFPLSYNKQPKVTRRRMQLINISPKFFCFMYKLRTSK